MWAGAFGAALLAGALACFSLSPASPLSALSPSPASSSVSALVSALVCGIKPRALASSSESWMVVVRPQGSPVATSYSRRVIRPPPSCRRRAGG
ncbi:Uncharacterised protein [Mycobacteroides abscessus subsp. abscessus]|nr:Uncharacterised protein [Mycobacteroides abscessus subsp. abscessus]